MCLGLARFGNPVAKWYPWFDTMPGDVLRAAQRQDHFRQVNSSIISGIKGHVMSLAVTLKQLRGPLPAKQTIVYQPP